MSPGRARRAALRWAVTLGIGAISACGPPADRSLSTHGLYGAELAQPRPKPSFILQDVRGAPFNFGARTRGMLTLLFFGYTSCPDVCPVHMANLGAVMKVLPVESTERIRVVFVTTDPARDTPERLRRWLATFDPSFIGLTGAPDELVRAQVAAGVLPAFRATAPNDPPGSAADSGYSVGHAAQVIAYTPDGLERAQYPSGTRQADWAHDLPILLRFGGER